MNISVFGLGYVGIVTAGCLCKDGHRVIGVDVSPAKVDQLNAGHSPIIEEGIEDLIRAARDSGRLSATSSAADAIAATDLAIVCVGTPSEPNGSLSTRYIEGVVAQIGEQLRARSKPFLVVLRSTMLPGTMRSLVLPLLTEQSGSAPGAKFDVVFHPEFLREGTSIKDFYDPPKIVVGERAPGAADQLMELYAGFTAPVFRVSYEAAEMVKYCDNIFHALKITFANEIGQFCHSLGIDSREVMDIFCSDTKLNLSPKYLRPGFAFGGSCLPKDLRAFLHAARRRDVSTPMLAAVLPSNKGQIERVLDEILRTGARRVGFWGLAFKPGTDDLRESPLVTLAELLGGKGVELKIHDEFVQVTRLIGGNKAFIEQTLPHLARLLVTNAAELDACELIVLGHPVDAKTLATWLERGKKVYDLTGMKNPPKHANFQSVN
jgi:GDP-mannose 6-dehydrogenase